MKVYFNNQEQVLFVDDVISIMLDDIEEFPKTNESSSYKFFTVRLRSAYGIQNSYDLQIKDGDKVVIKIEHEGKKVSIKDMWFAAEYRRWLVDELENFIQNNSRLF